MKIIKPSPLPFWVNKKYICINCKAVLQPEKGDPITEGSDRDGAYIKFNCPACSREIFVSKP